MLQPLVNPYQKKERNRGENLGGIGTIIAFRATKGNIFATTMIGAGLSTMGTLRDNHGLQQAITVNSLSAMSLYTGLTLAKPLVDIGTSTFLDYLKKADKTNPGVKLLDYLLEKRGTSSLLKAVVNRQGLVGAIGALALLGGYSVASNAYQGVSIRAQGSSIKGPEDYLPEKFSKDVYKRNPDSNLKGDFKMYGMYHK